MSGHPVPSPPSIADGSVKGVGVDIIEIERVRLAVERGGDRLVARVFTPFEASYCNGKRHPERHFAARFAAKEAVVKALRVPPGLGWLWSQIEVASAGGPPGIRLDGKARERARALGVSTCHVTLSHSDSHAIAMVVLT